jgi:hypothetical protein
MVASISMAQFSLADTNVLVAMKLICQYVPILKSVASRFQRMPMDQWRVVVWFYAETIHVS